MYAIIAEGGQQHKVEPGQEVQFDYRESSVGDKVQFEQVLAYNNGDQVVIGQPLVKGASVHGEVVGTSQGPKLVVQKFRRRKNSRRKTGHRQLYTTVKISKLDLPS